MNFRLKGGIKKKKTHPRGAEIPNTSLHVVTSYMTRPQSSAHDVRERVRRRVFREEKKKKTRNP